MQFTASSETQGQLVGTIKCSWWKFSVRSILQKTLTTNILSTRLTRGPWVSEDEFTVECVANFE